MHHITKVYQPLSTKPLSEGICYNHSFIYIHIYIFKRWITYSSTAAGETQIPVMTVLAKLVLVVLQQLESQRLANSSTESKALKHRDQQYIALQGDACLFVN